MSLAGVTEITAASPESFDDAVRRGVARATKTVRNIESAWVKEMKLDVSGGVPPEYRVTMKVSFLRD
jgi:flavin-binding protein dodecin